MKIAVGIDRNEASATDTITVAAIPRNTITTARM